MMVSPHIALQLMTLTTHLVFTISIGSIPAKQTVSTKIVFVMDLLDDEFIDEVRLQLPMSVGCRYGTPPPSLATSAETSTSTRLRITVDIQMSGVIQQISSPTHLIKEAPFVTHAGHASRHRKMTKFRSQTFLTGDFVLLVRADGLDAPRCFAERDHSGTIALQLTLIPKIRLPPLPSQEYLFVVDRSGSMAGAPITIAKSALSMMLRMLPSSQTLFNIFSFGSVVDSLWPTSQEYSQYSLDSAVSINFHSFVLPLIKFSDPTC
jgi:von Willebrand factor type A domain